MHGIYVNIPTPSAPHSPPPSPLLPELHDVLRVRLRVVVGHEDARVAHVVDGRVEEDRAVARRRRERVLHAAAVLADDDPGEEHVLHALRVGPRVGGARGVVRVARKVDALAVDGRVLAWLGLRKG